MSRLLHGLGLLAVLYPLLMALLWCVLALLWSWRREWSERWLSVAPQGEQGPPVSVLIPCFNEGPNLAETLRAALSLHWSDWEVIAINDGSSDDTGRQLEAFAAADPRLRVVHLASNQGKALALRAGALLARHELLVCIDGDALLDPHAVGWLVRHFQWDRRLAAVTGNPRIRNRTSLLGRLQVGEFSMIVGLIKRAQSMLGGLFCVSGVIGCFRRGALQAVGFWDPARLTEDIDITWRLQRAGWRVRYEPHALVWILMPETLNGLWRQRRRWADGGLQVLRANLDVLWTPGQWRLLPLLLEPLASVVWAHLLALLLLLAALAPVLPGAQGLAIGALLPHGLGLALLLACALQFAVSFWLDRPYDVGLERIGFWMIWYPAAYWLLSFAATLRACWRWTPRRSAVRARWISPDRGLRA
ncbi:MAG: N-glycosyltransferase [Cyanobium sp. CACIAM 14]|nr:MAG: N-glycosyltransferase [Cyanobium sp. CACIAM 14]